MKKILIISSTNNSNFDLSKDIKFFFDKKEGILSEVISLEKYELPLYTPTLENDFETTKSFPEQIQILKDILLNSEAIIWCSPEYNGGVPPILTNCIAWISRATSNWKDAFSEKKMLVCSSSGGNGKSFVESFKLQLKYLGSYVSENSIIKTKKNNYDVNIFEDTLNDFYKSIKS